MPKINVSFIIGQIVAIKHRYKPKTGRVGTLNHLVRIRVNSLAITSINDTLGGNVMGRFVRVSYNFKMGCVVCNECGANIPMPLVF